MMNLNIKDTFNKELPADPILENSRRQVREACFSYVTPRKTSKPALLHVSPEMLSALGLSIDDGKSAEFLKLYLRNEVF